jgi:hypothetical protein
VLVILGYHSFFRACLVRYQTAPQFATLLTPQFYQVFGSLLELRCSRISLMSCNAFLTPNLDKTLANDLFTQLLAQPRTWRVGAVQTDPLY